MNPLSLNTSKNKTESDKNKTESNIAPAKIVTFDNGNSAHLVTVAPKTTPEQLLHSLQLEKLAKKPNALIVLSGGAAKFEQLDQGLQLRLQQLFGRGIVRAAVEIEAGFITGGTDSGVIALLGQNVAEYHCQSPLIGIAPAPLITYPNHVPPEEEQLSDQVSLEPNHTHFILVKTPQWGGETETMYQLVSAFKTQTENLPIFTVLVNGGDISRLEVLQSVRLGIPIIVIEGSGRLADEIAILYREYQESDFTKFIENPALAEIIAEGTIHLFSIEGSATEFRRLLHRSYQQLQGDNVLQVAWRQFSLYDYNANRQKRFFHRLQRIILGLGVFGTLLVLIREEWTRLHEVKNDVLHYLIVFVPIVTTVLLAVANRFNAGMKWILLRAHAEMVKIEIFRFRTRAEIYSNSNTQEIKPEMKFANRLQKIAQDLVQTEANVSCLQQPKKDIIPPSHCLASDDDGLSMLSPESYIKIRLEDQLHYYTNKVKKLEKRLKFLQSLIYVIGGISTFLAAIGFELWIALTTALVTALTAHMEYQNIEDTLIKYNQAATHLFSVRTWWIALPETEQAKQANIDLLVKKTEETLQREFSGWLEEMHETLTELQEQQHKEQSSNQELKQSVDKVS